MTGNEMDGLVDKLADKLDVAVDKVLPVAQEALDQYVAREYLFATCAFVGAALTLALTVFLFIKASKSCEEGYWMGGVVTSCLFLGLTLQGICCLGSAVAPLAALVGI